MTADYGDCLELVAEDLKNHDWYRDGCVNCLQEIAVLGGVLASWPNTKDQTPYLAIRRCNTSITTSVRLIG